MLSISFKGIYGLSAMLELALNYNRESIQIKDIAEAHNIPHHYLEQLLVILKKSGLVKSFRGPQGGYALARNPGEIKVKEILTSLDGKLEIVPGKKQADALSFFWNRVESWILEILDISLEELILEKQRSEKQVVYNI